MLLGSCGAVGADPLEHHPNTHRTSSFGHPSGPGSFGGHSIFENDSHPAPAPHFQPSHENHESHVSQPHSGFFGSSASQPHNSFNSSVSQPHNSFNTSVSQPHNGFFNSSMTQPRHASAWNNHAGGTRVNIGGGGNAFNGARPSGSYSQSYNYGDQNVNGSVAPPPSDPNASFSTNRPVYQRSQWVEITPQHKASGAAAHPRVTYGSAANSSMHSFQTVPSVSVSHPKAQAHKAASKVASNSSSSNNSAQLAQFNQAMALGAGGAIAYGLYTSSYYYGYYTPGTAPTFSYYPSNAGVFHFNGATVPLSPVGPYGGPVPTGNAAYYGVPSHAVGQYGAVPNGTAAFYGVPSYAVGAFGAVPNGTAAFYGVPSHAVGAFGLVPNATAAFYGVPSYAVGPYGAVPNATAAFYGVPSYAVGQYGAVPNATAAYYGVPSYAVGLYGQSLGTPAFTMTSFQRAFYRNMYFI
jgi:hypothetical protein